jgi:hypothetical protein
MDLALAILNKTQSS